jgi:hypothetical protein
VPLSLATVPLDFTRQRTLADVLLLLTTNGTRYFMRPRIIERDCIAGLNPHLLVAVPVRRRLD